MNLQSQFFHGYIDKVRTSASYVYVGTLSRIEFQGSNRGAIVGQKTSTPKALGERLGTRIEWYVRCRQNMYIV